jgi:hypothetical protein
MQEHRQICPVVFARSLICPNVFRPTPDLPGCFFFARRPIRHIFISLHMTPKVSYVGLGFKLGLWLELLSF